MKPLIKNFKSTNVWKAFALNSIAATFIIVITISVKAALDNYTVKSNGGGANILYDQSNKQEKNTTNDEGKDRVKSKTNVLSITVTILVAFCASFLSYSVLYLLFGFGGGMLVN